VKGGLPLARRLQESPESLRNLGRGQIGAVQPCALIVQVDFF